MAISIMETMHPVFETLALSFAYHNKDTITERAIKALDDMGFDGEALVLGKLEYMKDYLGDFGRNFQPHSEDDLFFGGSDTGFFTIPALVLMEQPRCLTELDRLSRRELRQFFVEILSEEEVDADEDKEMELTDCVRFIAALDVEDDIKWRILQLFRDPHHYLRALIEIYRDNRAAYEEAAKNQEAIFQQRMANFQDNFSSSYLELMEKLAPDAVIYPSLAAPLAEFIGFKVSIYGLFLDELPDWDGSGEKAKENLLVVLKAMSDKSKFEILSSLKENPKYNLEIARDVGLTAATTSHHMNTLLSCGLVTVEKRDGRVYYQLVDKEVELAIEHLKKYLL
ncbi:MAG: winged helix-turn-helix domain-containing protein [Bacillota bacterium]|nr:winged helix-turn-helix domain-containing protein [Bacillota bacterium]